MIRNLGITLEDPWETESIVAFLKRLPLKVWLRVPFDLGVPAIEYAPVLRALRPSVAGILGEILDSESLVEISVADYNKRVAEFFGRLHRDVDIWETLNEPNGDWTGKPQDVAKKGEDAFRAISVMSGNTAITPYLTRIEDWEKWCERNLSAVFRSGVTWAMMSSYPLEEGFAELTAKKWNDLFSRMERLFPNSMLGIGEFGLDNKNYKKSKLADRMAMCTRHWTMPITHPKYLGAFYWNGSDEIRHNPDKFAEAIINVMNGETK